MVPILIPATTFMLGTSHVQHTSQFILGAQHIHQFASPPDSTQDALLKEIRDLKNKVQIIQQGSLKKKFFSFEEICPSPYDPSISMAPYPPRFEMPKFTKYEGQGDPHDHVQ